LIKFIGLNFWIVWCLNMLYNGFTKRLKVSISLTSNIKANDNVLYGGVAQAQTKVPKVRTADNKK
jgi:hypothetical protein